MNSIEAFFSAPRGAFAAAVIAAVGWLVAYILNGVRDDRTRRLQLAIEHTAEQVRDFYAPLVSLTDQLDSLANVFDLMLAENRDETLRWTFYGKFFLPVHRQIIEILSSKVYLLEGAAIPPSFKSYFEHFAAENSIYELNTSGVHVLGHVNVPPYPPNFYWDVRKGFDTVLKRYEMAVSKVRSG